MKTIFRRAVSAAVLLIVVLLAQTSARQVNAQTGAQPITASAEAFSVSVPARTLAVSPEDLTLNREINPRHNPLQFEPDMGRRGTWDRLNVPTDPLIGRGVNALLNTPPIILNFDATGNPVGCGGCSPPDVVGDVGPNHYVHMVNATKVAVFDKSGNPLNTPFNLGSLWTSGTCSSNAGDPIPVYDELADRWLITQFAFPNHMCLAVSQTPDPLGSYNLYTFNVGSFPDYFKFGVWPDGYYMSANESSYTAYAFNRTKMLAGDASAEFVKFTGQNNFLLPADLDGATAPPAGAPNIFYTFKDNNFHGGGADRLELFALVPNWSNTANSTFNLVETIPVAAFTYTPCGFFNFSCIRQLGTGQRFDALGEWPMFRFPYRNLGSHQVMVGTYSVGGGLGEEGSAIRWFELRGDGSDWSLHQEGTLDPGDGHDRMNSSIAMDSAGNIAIGYTVSSSTINPGIRYALREAGDPLGTLRAEQVLLNGGGSQTGSNRWGDYSAMSIDPADDCTFWYTNEYYSSNSGSSWKTRVGTFKSPNCGAPSFIIDTPSANEVVCVGQNAVYDLSFEPGGGFNDVVTLSTAGNPGNASFSVNPLSSLPADVQLTISGAPVGDYAFNVLANSASFDAEQLLGLVVTSGAPSGLNALAPQNGAVIANSAPTLQWAADGAASYDIVIATDPDLNDVVASASGLPTAQYAPTLPGRQIYYWQVTAHNGCGSRTSALFAFSTYAAAEAQCITPNLSIPDSSTATTSILAGVGNTALEDLDVEVVLDHLAVGDLVIDLQHLATGTTVRLIDRPGAGSGPFETGCRNPDIDAIFDSAAATTAEDSCNAAPPAIGGRVQPTGNLAGFNGELLDGNWRLSIRDQLNVGGAAGTLVRWCLRPTINGISGAADYSNLPNSYGVALHTGDDSLRLGHTWTADTDFSTLSDVNDGVNVAALTPGVAGNVALDVQGGNGWAQMWFDWNRSGTFDANELVINAAVAAGVRMFSVTPPANAGPLAGTPYRVRLFDSAAEPTARTSQPTGLFEGGEVEDYVLGSVPTAVSTNTVTAGQATWLLPLIALLALAAVAVALLRTRRQ